MPSASSRCRTAGAENRDTARTRLRAAGAADGPLDAPRERRSHLARRADDQDVALQAADAVEIGRGRLGEEVLELGLVADLRLASEAQPDA